MNSTSTQGIVLSRTEFGEADRIITFLTSNHGKVRVLAKGVRKQKSKLAGGIELFSVSDISYLAGRGEIHTLVSTRMLKHYGNIVKDLNRTNTGYELIKTLSKATEDSPEPAYFNLLKDAFISLDDAQIDLNLIKVWFYAQLLKLAGHSPNLRTDQDGRKLQAAKKYDFNFDTMGFQESQAGHHSFGADQIKFLRLIFSDNPLAILQKIEKAQNLASRCQPLMQSMLQAHVRI